MGRIGARKLKALVGIPDHGQRASYTCGVAALRAVLGYLSAWEGPEEDLEEMLGVDPEVGTEPERMVEVARDLGAPAKLLRGMTIEDLRQHVEAGEPVIVGYQAWRERGEGGPWRESVESGHYAVVRGFGGGKVLLKDPVLPGTTAIPVGEFEERWRTVDGERLGIVFAR